MIRRDKISSSRLADVSVSSRRHRQWITRWEMDRSAGVTKTGHGEWKEPSRVGRLNVKRCIIIVRFHQNCQARPAGAEPTSRHRHRVDSNAALAITGIFGVRELAPAVRVAESRSTQ